MSSSKIQTRICSDPNRFAYGYCEETGDEIGIARLEIRPVATLCVEAQERRERSERQFVETR